MKWNMFLVLFVCLRATLRAKKS